MADNFIPLNQSTPVQYRRNSRNLNEIYQNVYHHNKYNWKNNGSRRSSSFGSESNSSYTKDTKISIDAYLHPSMLQDPWEPLRRNN